MNLEEYQITNIYLAWLELSGKTSDTLHQPLDIIIWVLSPKYFLPYLCLTAQMISIHAW